MSSPTTTLVVAIVCGGALLIAYMVLSKPRVEYVDPEYKNVQGALSFLKGLGL